MRRESWGFWRRLDLARLGFLLMVAVLVLSGSPVSGSATTDVGLVDEWILAKISVIDVLIGQPVAMVAGDFTGDGNVDLVLAVVNDGASYLSRLVLLPGSGDVGVFGKSVVITREQLRPPRRGAFGSLLAIDLDADGHLDVVAVLQTVEVREGVDLSTLQSTFVVLWGDGSGGFQEERIEVDLGFFPFANILAIDLNADGLVDLAYPDMQRLSVSILHGLYGDGRRAFQGPYAVSLVHEEDQGCIPIPVRISAGDFDCNGFMDIVVLGFCQETWDPSPVKRFVQVLIGNGTVAFGRKPLHIVGRIERTVNIADLQVGEFSGDRHLDLIITRRLKPQGEDELAWPTEEEVVLLTGKGDGSFAAPLFLAGVGGSYGLRLVHVSHSPQGVIAMVVGMRRKGVSIIAVRSQGHTEHLWIPIRNNEDCVAVDLDNDGGLEIVCACQTENADVTQLVVLRRRSQ